MTDKEQNKSEVEQAPTPKDGSTGMNLLGKDRRRFIKRAIIAAPFILTVTSRPVWACNCTLSGQLSGNLSGNQDNDCGEGCTPGYWKNHDWSMTAYNRSMLYSDVFKVDVVFNEDESPMTLDDVIMKDPPVDLDEMLAFHAVAAILNATDPRVDFIYTDSQVIKYVKKVYNNGWDIEMVKDNFVDLNELGSSLCN